MYTGNTEVAGRSLSVKSGGLVSDDFFCACYCFVVGSMSLVSTVKTSIEVSCEQPTSQLCIDAYRVLVLLLPLLCCYIIVLGGGGGSSGGGGVAVAVLLLPAAVRHRVPGGHVGAGSLNLIPLFSFSSSYRDFVCTPWLYYFVSHLRSRFAFIHPR